MRENFTPFEQEIMRELALSANKMIMPYDFIAEHVDAIAIELDEDKKFSIVINEDIPNHPEYSKGEKSVLDIMHIISYLENQELIVIEPFTKEELKIKDKKIRIYNKEKYDYYESDGTDVLEDSFFYDHYLLKGFEKNPSVEILSEIKLKSGVYVYEFMEKHYGRFLYVSPALVELVKCNFKTHDQIRSEKQIKYSQGAFYVALFAFIVSLVSAIITQSSNENDLIRTEIRSVKTQTPKLINQQIKNDTLKVNMIKK